MTLGIVTLSYNQGRFLREAIESVLVTRDVGLQYVIVDPGSRDNSREIISQYSHRFTRAILEPDLGPADGLNKGFAACPDAEMLGYLNADDRFCPGALDEVAETFEQNPTIDLILGGIRIIDEQGRRRPRGRCADKPNLAKLAAKASFIWQQGTFFRRSAFERVGGFNTENRATWDSELAINILLSGANALIIDRALGEFRIYPASLTGSGSLKVEAEQQRHRLRQRMISAGVHVYTPVREHWSRIQYKYSAARHLRNLLLG